MTLEQLRAAIREAQLHADFPAVERWAHELASRCSALGDAVGQGDAYAYLGGALVARNEGRGARAAYQRARELYESADDLHGVARAINGLAHVAMDIDLNLSEALRFLDESLPIAREFGEPRLVGVILGNLSEAQRLEGDYVRAIRTAREALEILDVAGDAPRAAWQLINIAHCQFLQKKRSDAVSTMRAAYEYLSGATYDARMVAWYFDVWFIIAAGYGQWRTAALLLGFVNQYRADKSLIRLQLLLPWLSGPTEEMWRRLPGDTGAQLLAEGAALSMEAADALTRKAPFQ